MYFVLWLQSLFYTELPFSEDLRQFTFGSLPVEEVDAASQAQSRKFIPTGEFANGKIYDKIRVFILLNLNNYNNSNIHSHCGLRIRNTYFISIHQVSLPVNFQYFATY